MTDTEHAEAAADTRTRAAKAFDRFMAGKNPTKEPIVQRVAAAALDITEPTITNYRTGKYVPPWPKRWRIEQWTGGDVKAVWWADDAERAELEAGERITPYGTDKARSRAKPKSKRSKRG